MFLLIPRYLLAVFGMTDMLVIDIGAQLLRYLSVSGLFVTVALSYTGGLQGTGDTRSPLYISILSQVVDTARPLLLLRGHCRPRGGLHLDGDPRAATSRDAG